MSTDCVPFVADMGFFVMRETTCYLLSLTIIKLILLKRLTLPEYILMTKLIFIILISNKW